MHPGRPIYAWFDRENDRCYNDGHREYRAAGRRGGNGGSSVEEVMLSAAFPEWERIPDLGLYMDQVITFMERAFSEALPEGEITRSMVNNYVKSGLLPRPVGKKYDREHLALLIMIFLLKQVLSMEDIALLLEAVCAGGVREGYDRFVQEIGAMEEEMARGQLAPSAAGADAPGRVLRLCVGAALCAVRARRQLQTLGGGR